MIVWRLIGRARGRARHAIHQLRTGIADYRAKRLSSRYRLGDQGQYRRIYFYHVQKAGGSSLKTTFYELSGKGRAELHPLLTRPPFRHFEGNLVYVSWDKRLIEGGDYFFAGTHYPASEFTLPDATFTVTCLRNPVDRILSRYRELVQYSQTEPDHIHLQEVQDWFSVDFDAFIQNMPRTELLHQLHMFSPDYDVDQAFERVVSCTHFFVLEDYEDGVKQLGIKLGLDLKPKHIRATRKDTVPPADTLARLEALIEPEIRLYQRVSEAYYAAKDAAPPASGTD
jgi:hypothetical protein